MGSEMCIRDRCGTTPKYVTEKRFDIVREIERNPELWYRNKGPKQEISSLKRLANFVGARSHSDLVYVDNTTEGINIILKVCLIFKHNLP